MRTNNDRLYIFAPMPYSGVIYGYWANGLPSNTSDFAVAAQVTLPSFPISLDAVYDGINTIHVLVNTRIGDIVDYPFNTSTNSFNSPITLASDGGSVTGDYIGTSGLSAMLDLNGVLHITHWTKQNHIDHRAYVYDSALNNLTPTTTATQVDNSGSANHPVVAISPLDNSLTVAWISQSQIPTQILARTRTSAGVWGSIETLSTAPVWTSTSAGISIDQGPSLLISQDGIKHLLYVENWDNTGYYGHIHYVENRGSGWIDQTLSAYSHGPALAVNDLGEIYMIAHGHPLNQACLSMSDICTIKKNSNGSWGLPTLFAKSPINTTFDSSPSVKWSVVGFDRPDIIEFLFFATPYMNPTLYYGRFSMR